jgi:hypothetical protein
LKGDDYWITGETSIWGCCVLSPSPSSGPLLCWANAMPLHVMPHPDACVLRSNTMEQMSNQSDFNPSSPLTAASYVSSRLASARTRPQVSSISTRYHNSAAAVSLALYPRLASTPPCDLLCGENKIVGQTGGCQRATREKCESAQISTALRSPLGFPALVTPTLRKSEPSPPPPSTKPCP